jgi:hypothetical protein
VEKGFLSAHYDEPDRYDFPVQCSVGRWIIDLVFPGLTLPYLLRALRLYLIFRYCPFLCLPPLSFERLIHVIHLMCCFVLSMPFDLQTSFTGIAQRTSAQHWL